MQSPAPRHSNPTDAELVNFMLELQREHDAGRHVVPSFATCPGCMLARDSARQRAGLA
jgi:hypothetical protein